MNGWNKIELKFLASPLAHFRLRILNFFNINFTIWRTRPFQHNMNLQKLYQNGLKLTVHAYIFSLKNTCLILTCLKCHFIKKLFAQERWTLWRWFLAMSQRGTMFGHFVRSTLCLHTRFDFPYVFKLSNNWILQAGMGHIASRTLTSVPKRHAKTEAPVWTRLMIYWWA